MNFNSGRYLFLEGLKNLVTNKLMFLASVGVLTACLFVVGCSVLLTKNINRLIEFMGEQSTAVIFLKDNAKEQDISSLISNLNESELVKELNYVGKEQALKEYFSRFNNYSDRALDNETVMQILGENNVFPSSIDVKVKYAARVEEILDITKNFQIVDEVNLPTKFSNLIKSLGKTAGLVEIILIIALVMISLTIISNTIRATVFSRRKEVAIMKQVGATNNFIRFPFIIEGLSIGVISAVVAFVLTWLGYRTVLLILINNTSAFLNSMFSQLIDFSDVKIIVSCCFLLGGISTGVLGSLISLRKYLKN